MQIKKKSKNSLRLVIILKKKELFLTDIYLNFKSLINNYFLFFG
jgi:hypothetical protein